MYMSINRTQLPATIGRIKFLFRAWLNSSKLSDCGPPFWFTTVLYSQPPEKNSPE